MHHDFNFDCFIFILFLILILILILILNLIFILEKNLLQDGYQAYTTSTAWLGYTDEVLLQVRVRPSFIELLKQKILLKKSLLSYNEQDTSNKL